MTAVVNEQQRIMMDDGSRTHDCMIPKLTAYGLAGAVT